VNGDGSPPAIRETAKREVMNEADKNLQTVSEAEISTKADLAGGPGGNNSDGHLRVAASVRNGDRAGVDGEDSRTAEIGAKPDTGILTNQNSNDSAQSRLWRQEDGSVKATVFEGKKPREVVIRPKKSSRNFDQSKISPGILTNQKSRRGRPRNPDMPPVPGQYYYWKKDGNGLSLSYEPPIKNAKGKRIGQGYEYQGFLLPSDWEHLKGNFDEQTILSKIRAILKIKRFRTARGRAHRGTAISKRGEPGRSAEAG
jgi:hypothetical protein